MYAPVYAPLDGIGNGGAAEAQAKCKMQNAAVQRKVAQCRPRRRAPSSLDYDGLMLDTETAVFETWREFYESEGQHLAASDWLNAVGYVNGFDPRAHLEKLTGRGFHWPDHDSRLSRRTLELVAALPPFPGVRTLLENGARLGYRLGVASNSTADWVLPGLERLGLRRWFSVVRTPRNGDEPQTRAGRLSRRACGPRHPAAADGKHRVRGFRTRRARGEGGWIIRRGRAE